MLKIKVTEKSGAWLEYVSPNQLNYSSLGHGLPERWIPHKDEGGFYDDADVLDERMAEIVPAVPFQPEIPAVYEGGVMISEAIPAVPEVPAVMQKQVKLKAEYSVEITDISSEHALAECISKRKSEYPSAEDFLNAFFDGGEQALAALQAKRLAVKAKYPKP
jgi:hypothetical protein